MSFRKTILLAAFVILGGITLLHLALNLNAFAARPGGAASGPSFRVGFLPVTCHLTCPVTDFINKQLTGESSFDPVRFHGWPELKEAYLSGYTPATFILAPMAIALREQGVPIKIVYLGHREGGDVMVHKDSGIYRTQGLKRETRGGAGTLCKPPADPVSRVEEGRHEARGREHHRDAAAGYAGGALLPRRGCDHVGRASSRADGDGWLRPCAVSSARCLAGIHLVRAGGPRRGDQDAAR
jgi:hypothetical protein